MVGLGKMGANMTERLVKGGHDVVGYARHPEAVELVVEKGARGAESLEDLVGQLSTPKYVWVMVPAGRLLVSGAGCPGRRPRCFQPVVRHRQTSPPTDGPDRLWPS